MHRCVLCANRFRNVHMQSDWRRRNRHHRGSRVTRTWRVARHLGSRMTTLPSLGSQLRHVAESLAREAGDMALLGRKSGPLTATTKSSPIDMVTKFDKASEVMITQGLATTTSRRCDHRRRRRSQAWHFWNHMAHRPNRWNYKFLF
jgi:hypothetical protein